MLYLDPECLQNPHFLIAIDHQRSYVPLSTDDIIIPPYQWQKMLTEWLVMMCTWHTFIWMRKE